MDQQHSRRKEGQAAVVAAVAVVRNLSILDLDDLSSPDCICCLKDHNSVVVVVEPYYYKCWQYKLEEPQNLQQVLVKKDNNLSGGQWKCKAHILLLDLISDL